tara:strand:- start:362 stop:1699 length:1338 start_codon:yes stop_codon:yes gene_type:complete
METNKEGNNIFYDYQEGEEINLYLKELISILLKHKFFIAIVCFSSLILGFIYANTKKDLFQAKVVLETPLYQSSLIGTDDNDDPLKIKEIVKETQSLPFLFDAYVLYLSKKVPNPKITYNQWRKNLSIKDKDYRTLTIQFIDDDPEFISFYLNNFIQKIQDYSNKKYEQIEDKLIPAIITKIKDQKIKNTNLMSKLNSYSEKYKFDLELNPITGFVKIKLNKNELRSRRSGELILKIPEINELIFVINSNNVYLEELLDKKNQFTSFIEQKKPEWQLISKVEFEDKASLNSNKKRIIVLFFFIFTSVIISVIIFFEKLSKKVYSIERIKDLTKWGKVLIIKYENKQDWEEMIQTLRFKINTKNSKIGILFIGQIKNEKIKKIFEYFKNGFDNIYFIDDFSLLNLNKFDCIIPITFTGITKSTELNLIKSKLEIINFYIENFININ